MKEGYKNLKVFGYKVIGLSILWVLIEYSNVLNSSGLNEFFIHNLVYLSDQVLSLLGYKIFNESDIVGIVGTSGVLIGAPCNALDLMALFVGILVLLPGIFWQKLIYAAGGLILIHILNLLRVIVLILMVKSYPALLEFNHNYTFTLIMYVVIFFTWVLWIRFNNNGMPWQQKGHTKEQ